MAYVTPNDVREVLTPDGSAVPGKNTAAALSDAELAKAIADAQAQVDSALASSPTFYPVPFPDGQVPTLVQQVTRDIAAYLATLTWHRGQIPADHTVRRRYERVVGADERSGVLGQLASGVLLIPGFAATPAREGSVINFVPDEWTWHPDIGFGAGQRIPG